MTLWLESGGLEIANIGSGPSAADSIIAAFAERGEQRIAAFQASVSHILRDSDSVDFCIFGVFGPLDLVFFRPLKLSTLENSSILGCRFETLFSEFECFWGADFRDLRRFWGPLL